MKLLKKMGAAVFVMALSFVAASLTTEPTYAADGKETQGESYIYTAQPGDSYSQLARKAVQTYGVDNNVILTPAQIVYAETHLTRAAGNIYLNVGQKVIINKADVKQRVELAEKLKGDAALGWNWYVPFVDFRTNNIGE